MRSDIYLHCLRGLVLVSAKLAYDTYCKGFVKIPSNVYWLLTLKKSVFKYLHNKASTTIICLKFAFFLVIHYAITYGIKKGSS